LLLGAQILREERPDLPIFIGGRIIGYGLRHRFQWAPPDLLWRHHALFDAAIAGYPEQALLAILDDPKTWDARAIPGVVPAHQLATPLPFQATTSPAPPLVTPDFSALPLGQYLSPALCLPLVTSRGCYWARCAFCEQAGRAEPHTAYPPDAVAAHMIALQARHADACFYLADLAVPPESLAEIATVLRDQGAPPRWGAQVRFEGDLTRERLALLFAGGCRYLEFGLESVNAEVNARMRKGTSRGEIERILGDAFDLGLHTRALLFFGFPGETEAQAQETLDFVVQHAEQLSAVRIVPFLLVPESAVWHSHEQFGITHIDAHWGYTTACGMSQSEAEAFVEQALAVLDRQVVRGHPLYHHTILAAPLAARDAEPGSAFPLYALPRAEWARRWRGHTGQGPLRLHPDLATLRLPFVATPHGPWQRTAEADTVACLNLFAPDSRLQLFTANAWEALPDTPAEALEELLQTGVLLPQGAVGK
jgi:hypothetical protein